MRLTIYKLIVFGSVWMKLVCGYFTSDCEFLALLCSFLHLEMLYDGFLIGI